MSARVRRILTALGALALVAAYWGLDRLVGPFAQAHQYGTADNSRWRAAMGLGEWWWYLALVLASAAAVCVVLLWRAGREGEDKSPAGYRFVALAALTAVVVVLAIRAFVLDGAPVYDDEMVYRFQAQTIAGGHLTAPVPPALNPFRHPFIGMYRGHWFGQYSFGHPAILALGEKIGWPGLIGALQLAMMVALIFLLTRRLFGPRTATVAAFFAAASPMLVSTGATVLSQNSATPLVLLGVLLTLIAAQTGRFVHVLGAALALGAAFWCRQMEPAVMALGPLMLLLRRIWRGPGRTGLLAGGLLGSAIVIAPLLWLQWRLWGNPFWTNYQAYWWGYCEVKLVSPFGFGPAPMTFHTPLKGLLYTMQNLVRLDLFLLGVPGALALAGFGLATHRRNSEAWAVFAGVPLSFAMLFFYFWPSLADTGPLLYHTAGALLLPFVAAGALRLLDAARRPAVAVLAVIAIAVVTFWPAHLGALHRTAHAATELQRLTTVRGIHHAIVFSRRHPWPPGGAQSAVNTLPVSRPDLSDDVLFLVTEGKPVDTALAAEHFPDRDLYYLEFIDGKIALLLLDEYTGRDSLRRAAVPRDLPGF